MAQDKPADVMGDIINNHGIVTQGQIGNNTIVNPIRRDPDGFYQGDKKVGSAPAPVIDDASQMAVFRAAGFNAFPNPDLPLEYGNLILSSESAPRPPRPGFFAAQISIAIAGFQAKIIGRK